MEDSARNTDSPTLVALNNIQRDLIILRGRVNSIASRGMTTSSGLDWSAVDKRTMRAAAMLPDPLRLPRIDATNELTFAEVVTYLCDHDEAERESRGRMARRAAWAPGRVILTHPYDGPMRTKDIRNHTEDWEPWSPEFRDVLAEDWEVVP